MPTELQGLSATGSSAATSSSSSSILTAFSDFNTLAGPENLAAAFSRTFTSGGSFITGAYRSGLQAKDLPKIAEEDAGAAKVATRSWVSESSIERPVLAGVGRAEPIGGLSVPQTWASATPIASAVEDPHWLSEMDLNAVPASETTMTNMPGAGPMVGMAPQPGAWSRPTVNNVLRVPAGRFKMPRPLLGG